MDAEDIYVHRSDPDWTMSDEMQEGNAVQNNKARKRTSSVWNYCDVINNNYAMCRICHHKLSYKSSVTNLRKHFKKKHPDISMPPNMQFLQNRPIRIRENDLSSDDEGRNEVQRATKSVIVDYLRPAGDESHPRISGVVGNFSKYAHTVKRERSPARFDCRVAAKHSRESKSEETELELFGRSIVMQLKTLPLVHALEVQAEITNLIVQKRIQALRHSQETITEETPMQYALVYAEPAPQEMCRDEVVTVPTKDTSQAQEEERVSASC